MRRRGSSRRLRLLGWRSRSGMLAEARRLSARVQKTAHFAQSALASPSAEGPSDLLQRAAARLAPRIRCRLAGCIGPASAENALRAQKEYELSVGLLGEQNTPAAFEHLFKARELDPLNPEPHQLLGNLYLLRGDLEQSRGRTARSAQSSPRRMPRTDRPSWPRSRTASASCWSTKSATTMPSRCCARRPAIC